MIISRTPFRISLFGGGTDYPDWYLKHGGHVLGTTIDKYCYLSVRNLPPFFEHRSRIVYSKIESINHLDEIEHPAVKAVLKELNFADRRVEMTHFSDLPARSGLGSSSSFTVGLINALRALDHIESSAEFLAKEAIRIEQQVIGECVGSQDQMWAAYGGTNHIEFKTDGQINVSPIHAPQEMFDILNSHLLLFFTGVTRIAETIASKQVQNIDNTYQQLSTMKNIALEAKSIMQSEHPDILQIGKMLHDNWMLKQELANEISNPCIQQVYQTGIDAGALGGKILGAGGGGFMLFFAKPEQHQHIIQRLNKLIHVNIRINSPGSKIVVQEPGGLGII